MSDAIREELEDFLFEHGHSSLLAYLGLPNNTTTSERRLAFSARRKWAQKQRNNTKYRRECDWLLRNYRLLEEILLTDGGIPQSGPLDADVTVEELGLEDLFAEHVDFSSVQDPNSDPDVSPASPVAVHSLDHDFHMLDLQTQLHRAEQKGQLSAAWLRDLRQLVALGSLTEQQAALLLRDETSWRRDIDKNDTQNQDRTPLNGGK